MGAALSASGDFVLRFIDSWRSRNLDRILTFLTEDCVYHNVPLEPVIGIAAIRESLAGFVAQFHEIDWIVHHLAESSGGVVLTERSDRFLLSSGWLDIPVMGVFELADGRIRAWRDYFDLKQFNDRMSALAAKD